jgi:hypothetical protein
MHRFSAEEFFKATITLFIVATEHDSLYAFDADTGVLYWQSVLLGSGETTSEPRFGCDQVTPEVGTTATPVIDRNKGAHGTIYVVAMSKLSTTAVITTRTPVADIADHERTSALRRDLNQLSSVAGAQLLRALGVKGDDAELRSANDEFDGHCLALTLLGSYLDEAYNGDVRRRTEVSTHLAHDVRQGIHARKVMESYQTWFGEGPELSVLRMLGLFDRPADEKAVAALLRSPAIPGLTESLTDLSPTEWRTLLAGLRRASTAC